jgi:5'-nucleotidase/UDP-sugar diphosphatase
MVQAAQDAPKAGPDRNLIVLFTHDLHSNLEEYAMPSADGGTVITGGYARLASAIQKERRGRERDVLLVDGGDFSMGTLFHTIRSSRSPELIAMGMMGYDATTFGNHEFEFGPGPLAQALLTAKKLRRGKLPVLVASNTVADSRNRSLAGFRRAWKTYPVKPFHVIRRAGLKIGLFGLMGKDAALYSPEAAPLTFSDHVEAARKTVAILRQKERVDMVIALSHSGTWADKSISEDELLAAAVPGIDVIISGHTHTVLDPYIRVGDTFIVSAGCYARFLGRLEMARTADGKFRAVGYRLIPVTSALAEDPRISRFIESCRKEITKSYLAAFKYRYGQPLARIDFPLADPDWDKGHDRDKFLSSGLGDLVGDAFRHAVNQAEGKNDRAVSLVIEGFGQIRVPLARGPLSVNDAFRLMALGLGPDGRAGMPLVTFWLSGGDIRNMLELETTLAPAKYDFRLQITGLRFSYDPKATPFARVRTVETETPGGGWQPLEEGRLYRICTNWKTLAMRDNLKILSGGKLIFTPRDEKGAPVADLLQTRVFADSRRSVEMKEWSAVALYLQSLPLAGAGELPVVPEKYRTPSIPAASVTLPTGQ